MGLAVWDIKKRKEAEEKKKVIKVYLITGALGLCLFFGIKQLGVGNELWPQETMPIFGEAGPQEYQEVLPSTLP